MLLPARAHAAGRFGPRSLAALPALVFATSLGCGPEFVRPVAVAGADFESVAGETAALDGSKSHDDKERELRFEWRLDAVPAGSRAFLSDPAVARPWFVPDLPGKYVAKLIVAVEEGSGFRRSAPDSVTITVAPSAPVADAGEDLATTVGVATLLDGSASLDPLDRPLVFQWRFVALPAGSQAFLNNATLARPSFIPDVAGEYRVALVVSAESDLGAQQSGEDVVSVVAVASLPLAEAGADLAVNASDPVQLDGTASSDPRGRDLSYRWRLIEVPTASQAFLNNPTLARPSFIPDEPGSYVVGLVVLAPRENGALDESEEDRLTVTASDCTPISAASTEPRLTVDGELVALSDDSASPCDRPLSRRWELLTTPSGSLALLSDPFARTPSLYVDLPGLYRVRVTPTDARGLSGDPTELDVLVAPRAVDVATTGLHTSIVLRGAAEQPLIAYFDESDLDLKTASLTDDTRWTLSVVDTDGDVGRYPSLALRPDTTNLPRIAYYDATRAALKLAARAADGTWSTVTVDDEDDDDGQHASLALDPNTGAPRILYRAISAGRAVLKYAYCNATDCLDELNWARVVLHDDGDGHDVGAAAQLALDGDGSPRFSFLDETAGALRYGECVTPTCDASTSRIVDEAVGAAAEASLRLTPDGTPMIGYYDSLDGSARVASCEQDCASALAAWQVAALETTGDAGRSPSLALVPGSAEARLVWQRGGALRYATRAGGEWTITTLVAEGVGASERSLSLAVTAAGDPRVSFWGADARARFYRRGP